MPTLVNPRGIRKNNTTIRTTDFQVFVKLHGHQIAVFDKLSNTVDLDTCGYNTPTTIRRMNECLHHWGFNERVSKSSFANTNQIAIGTEP